MTHEGGRSLKRPVRPTRIVMLLAYAAFMEIAKRANLDSAGYAPGR